MVNDGCEGLQKCLEVYIMALFDARNAAHNLMVELAECEKAPMMEVSAIEDMMIEHDKEAQVLCDCYPRILGTMDPQVKEFLEIMRVIS